VTFTPMRVRPKNVPCRRLPRIAQRFAFNAALSVGRGLMNIGLVAELPSVEPFSGAACFHILWLH
jgi:hypothetical protein